MILKLVGLFLIISIVLIAISYVRETLHIADTLNDLGSDFTWQR